MADISLSFQIKDGRFSLCATVKGTSKRNYKEVQGLINPNFDSWEKKTQRFNEPTNEAIHNNNVLRIMRECYQHLIDTFNPYSGKELFEVHETASKILAEKELTLGEYVKNVISDLRHSATKMPSKNYQLYITLLHKLEIQRKLINIPLADIDDEHFRAFGQFVLNDLKGVNYLGLMKHFIAVIRKAQKNGLTSKILEYPYQEDTPTNNEKAIERARNGVHILTKKQYEKFLNLDLSKIPQSGPRREFYKELYRDFCIFLYEMKMRPCDVVCLRLTSIEDNKLFYLPAKKKNYKDLKNAYVSIPITKKAMNIALKYKGQSKKGYIFPFSMNEYDWDMRNSDSFNKWYNRKQSTLEKINTFLVKVKTELKVETLTLYTFRHSAFTHGINEGKNLLKIAKEGGTSIKMLENHYYNHLLA